MSPRMKSNIIAIITFHKHSLMNRNTREPRRFPTKSMSGQAIMDRFMARTLLKNERITTLHHHHNIITNLAFLPKNKHFIGKKWHEKHLSTAKQKRLRFPVR